MVFGESALEEVRNQPEIYVCDPYLPGFVLEEYWNRNRGGLLIDPVGEVSSSVFAAVEDSV